ncbi:MAG: hypothetical protein ACTFAK_11275 [Candidatus Electronema sp. VV]
MTYRDYVAKRRKAFRIVWFALGFILLGTAGLGCWIKLNEQELLQQVRQAKASGCPCKKKINPQPIIPQLKETCNE